MQQFRLHLWWSSRLPTANHDENLGAQLSEQAIRFLLDLQGLGQKFCASQRSQQGPMQVSHVLQQSAVALATSTVPARHCSDADSEAVRSLNMFQAKFFDYAGLDIVFARQMLSLFAWVDVLQRARVPVFERLCCSCTCST